MDYVWWAFLGLLLYTIASLRHHDNQIYALMDLNDTILKELGYRQELDEDPAQMSLDDFMEEE